MNFRAKPESWHWQRKWSCQAVCYRIETGPKFSGLAPSDAKCLARRSGAKFHLEILEMRQAVMHVVRGYIGGFYTALDERLETMTY